MDINDLVKLTARAWALPILAALADGVAGRQAALVTATGASRTAFAQSMEHLIQLGLADRNPGHGHPLRPEFRLTPQGQVAADLARGIQGYAGPTHLGLIKRSWSVPVLASLARYQHYGDVRRCLGPVTDRALSQTLRALEDNAWIQRRVIDTARPPRPVYRPINIGADITRMLGDRIHLPGTDTAMRQNPHL